MKNSAKTIKTILDVYQAPCVVVTTSKAALAELKAAGVTGMHRNREPTDEPVNLTGYDHGTIGIKIKIGE